MTSKNYAYGLTGWNDYWLRLWRLRLAIRLARFASRIADLAELVRGTELDPDNQPYLPFMDDPEDNARSVH